MDRGTKAAKAGVKAQPAHTPRKRAAAPARPLEAQLADALAREAATAEILRVIQTSRTDPKPVFEAIAEAALKLCDAASLWS